jgi:RNA polymerase sigma-70 factor (ECF subfamily)
MKAAQTTISRLPARGDDIPVTPASLDEALVARIADGDQLAMRTLYGRHRVRVYRFIRQMVKNPATAEDLVSDVFLDVWRHAGRFEHRSLVATWLLSIARHKALSALRKKREDELDPDMAHAIPDSADDPEAAIARKDRGAALRQCLTKLSPEHREIITLVYYHERSVEEVSDIVGIPRSTVKTRMFYARKRLAELLATEGYSRAA